MQGFLNDLVERLRSDNPQIREAAIHEMATQQTPVVVRALQQVATNDPDPNLRKLAEQFLANAPEIPSQPKSASERVYQMLWDCRFCGTPKLMGVEHRHCPNCGAAQDPAWRYYPSDQDLRTIKDPGYKYAGADKTCPFCGQPNSAAANWCKDCGGDLSQSKEVERKATLLAGMEGATGVRDDVVKQKFQREQAAIRGKAKSATSNRPLLIIGAVVILLLAIGGALVALSRSTYGSAMTVTDVSWQRTISVEQLRSQSGSGWRDSVPSDAYSVSCHVEDRCHSESEQYVCGSENVDRGDGSFTKRDKYCSRSKQVCVPDSRCSYLVNRWSHERDLTLNGGPADAPVWPSFSPSQTGNVVGAERESERTEAWNVIFKDSSGKKYTYNPADYARWQMFKVEQRYTVEINRLNRVQWDTLKPASAQ